MKELDAIQFYKGVLKLAPELLNLSETQICKRLGDAFKCIFAITPTRDHIRSAIANQKSNSIKRAWTLKYRYLVRSFMVNSDMTNSEAHALLLQKFNQRTRAGVIDSARTDAAAFDKEDKVSFIDTVEADYAKKAKDFDLFR